MVLCELPLWPVEFQRAPEAAGQENRHQQRWSADGGDEVDGLQSQHADMPLGPFGHLEDRRLHVRHGCELGQQDVDVEGIESTRRRITMQ